MPERPQLRLIDSNTGEVVEDEREVLIEQLTADLRTKQLAIGKLKRELKELRAVEPEAKVIRDVLGYWRDACKPSAQIAPASRRWEKVRARLKDRLDDRDPWTPAELKLAVDGALLDPWINGRARGSRGYLDAVTIFRDAEMVEKLRDLALGFKAQASVGVRDLIAVSAELRVVDWRQVLRLCECGHRRIEHVPGVEACIRCECREFFEDPMEWAENQPRGVTHAADHQVP